MSGRHGDRRWTDERAAAHEARWAAITPSTPDWLERSIANKGLDADDFPDLLDAWVAERKRADAADAALSKARLESIDLIEEVDLRSPRERGQLAMYEPSAWNNECAGVCGV